MKRKLMSIILLLITVQSLMGCSNRTNATVSEYNQVKEEVTLGNGKTINEIEEKLTKFTYQVYMGSGDKEISDAIESLSDIATDNEIKKLKQIAGKYNKSSKQKVENINVKYSNGNNNSDHMDKFIIKFELANGKSKKEVLIEFVVNPNNEIFRHTILERVL